MSDVLMNAGGRLPRASGVAVWRQIAGTIQAEIETGALGPGSKLPTEASLAARFGVNRHTVRRALEEISRNGLIVIEQGRGSFVVEDVLDYAVGRRSRFSEWIRAHNKEPSGRILALRIVPGEDLVAAGLGIPPGADVIRLDRLGLADGRPVSLGRHHFSARRFPGLLDALRIESTITEALRVVGVADYRRRTTRVGARLPTPSEAEHLGMPRAKPVLVTENVNVGPDGAIVEFGVTCYPTPRVQLVFEP